MRQLQCQSHSDQLRRFTVRYLDMQVDEAIEIAKYTISRSPRRYPQQRTRSAAKISLLIWELPRPLLYKRVNGHKVGLESCQDFPSATSCDVHDGLPPGAPI